MNNVVRKSDPGVDWIKIPGRVVRSWVDCSRMITGNPETVAFQDKLEECLDSAQGSVRNNDVEKVRYIVIEVVTGL